ncbi:hypothetical protein FB45DRAFT_919891 [Roridomyces roridus]|uniref:DUF6534 domain-containing protein n=1 Tax=Roridomyces roridus TaxID=1738132 RepID=A0AAD7BSN1_9AGAR|nr:hypothetical protein FB45DRAFT_919891 [Roridomyces roridus]
MSSLSVILGALAVTGIFSALSFGASSIQTYNYLHAYPTSRRLLQAFVAALWAVDAFQIAVYTYTVWYYVAIAYDSAWLPEIMNWSFKLSVWLAVALVLILDLFYTGYILLLACPNYIIPAIVATVVAAGNIVAVVLGVRIIIFTHFTEIYGISRSGLIYSFFGLFCVKAVGIAAAMCYFLYGSNEGFTWESNVSIVRRFIKLVVGSSLIVALCSFAVLACHLTMPHSMSCVVVYMTVSKLYHNCFLSLLACRQGQATLGPTCAGGIQSIGSSASRPSAAQEIRDDFMNAHAVGDGEKMKGKGEHGSDDETVHDHA